MIGQVVALIGALLVLIAGCASMPDGPRDDEILFVLAMSKGPRIHSRMGGLEVWQVKGEDGLR